MNALHYVMHAVVSPKISKYSRLNSDCLPIKPVVGSIGAEK